MMRKLTSLTEALIMIGANIAGRGAWQDENGTVRTVNVPLPVSLQSNSLGVSENMVQSAFEAAYLASFSRLLPGIAMRVVSLRVAAIGRRPAFNFAVFAPEPSASVEKARLRSRPVWFEGGWRDTAVWARLELPADAKIAGPAVLEQPDATTVIEPGLAGRIDRLGNLIVEPA
jgi:N-methylhydantoinase A